PGLPSEDLLTEEAELNWARNDFEQRFGFPGARFTAVNNAVSFLIALAMTVLFFVFVVYALNRMEPTQVVAAMFLRGLIPVPIAFLFFWCMAILFVKERKLNFQRRALDLKPFPEQPDFVLNSDTSKEVLASIHHSVDDTRHFVLFNRIERALSNLRNIGRISDVSDILQTQADYDEGHQESSYRLINGFIWAIPVLGFIGTVLGLSDAIGGFGATLAAAGEDMEMLKESLGGITGGLSTAFETTLIALVAALIVQVRMTFLQQREALFLDECNDYCHAHVVSRLRLTS
ncbi:MAG: MotA/TolQ/ExbB proton channel family protein, partial [Verrucomicrobiales bacterium]|nr:MotA/TolQ/ExbB proton channel family protein [Verrucomicrobiales bacterium]